MRFSYALVLIVSSMAVAQTAHNEFVGCLTQDANGTFLLHSFPSGKEFSVTGAVNLLQRNLNENVAITAHALAATATPSLTVDTVRVLTQSCNSPLPTENKLKVAGKVGIVQDAVPIALAGNADETTPGFQTENGVKEGESIQISAPDTVQSSRSPFRPANAEQAGQSTQAADLDAQAASRAELYPGTTLAVDINSRPPSSVQSIKSLGTGTSTPIQPK